MAQGQELVDLRCAEKNVFHTCVESFLGRIKQNFGAPAAPNPYCQHSANSWALPWPVIIPKICKNIQKAHSDKYVGNIKKHKKYKFLVASLLPVAMSGAPSSFLFLVQNLYFE